MRPEKMMKMVTSRRRELVAWGKREKKGKSIDRQTDHASRSTCNKAGITLSRGELDELFHQQLYEYSWAQEEGGEEAPSSSSA